MYLLVKMCLNVAALITVLMVTLVGAMPAQAVDGEWDPYAGILFDVNDLEVSATGVIYAAADESPNGYVAQWDSASSSWSGVGDLKAAVEGSLGALSVFTVEALAITSGTLYAAGQASPSFSSRYGYVYSWNGSTWTSVWEVGPQATPQASVVYHLAADSSGNVYAGGGFSGYLQRVAPSNQSITGASAVVSAMNSGPDGTVVIGFESGSLVATIANGSSATSVTAEAASGVSTRIYSIAVAANGDVYASVGAAGIIRVKSAGTWTDGPPLPVNQQAFVIATNGSGGIFAGGGLSPRAYELTGGAWSPLGTGLSSSVRAMTFDASGSLIAGGDFTDRVARWCPGSCQGTPSSEQAERPVMYTFSFLTSGGSPCLDDVAVARGSAFTLPNSSVACTPEGTAMVGWSIPGQVGNLSPGGAVIVSDSQVFTAVAMEQHIEISYDANVGYVSDDARSLVPCLDQSGRDLPLSERTFEKAASREGDVSATPACSPVGYSFSGWTDRPTTDGIGQAVEGALTLRADAEVPAIWSVIPNPVNAVRLYALWAVA